MALNKTQTWETVVAEINSTDIKEETKESLINSLAELLAPKRAHSAHPPLLDEEGNPTDYWCRYHQEYEPVKDMVLNAKGESKGYCKAASAISNKRRKLVQTKRLEALRIMGDDIVKAQELVKEADAIEPTINNPEYYNLAEDWEEFNK